MPREVAEMYVVNSDVKSVEKAGTVDFVFSALPSDVAGPLEEEFAKTYHVFSKASAHRLEEDVPLLIPEVNPEHLELERFHIYRSQLFNNTVGNNIKTLNVVRPEKSCSFNDASLQWGRLFYSVMETIFHYGSSRTRGTGASGGLRSRDLRLTRPLLYQAELPRRFVLTFCMLS
jgi:hypothetical protein